MFKDGRIFIGQWKNNVMNGYGEYHWIDGRKYMGFYLNDKKEGFGVYVWSENKAYYGFWKDGQQHGIGRYINKGENKYGIWECGKRTKWFQNDIEAMSLLVGDEICFKEKFYIDIVDIIKSLDTFKDDISMLFL